MSVPVSGGNWYVGDVFLYLSWSGLADEPIGLRTDGFGEIDTIDSARGSVFAVQGNSHV